MTQRKRGPGVLFHAAAASATVFIITVLAMVATLFAHPAAAPVNEWLNRHGAWLLGLEVALIVLTSCAAMAFDQWRTSREKKPSELDTKP